MENEKNSRFKTTLVVLIFIMIIFLSSYIVVSKITNKAKPDDSQASKKEGNSVLTNSKLITELSINNGKVRELYQLINHPQIDYLLYLNMGEKLSWDVKSLMVVSSLDEKDIIKITSDEFFVAKDIFEQQYLTLFAVAVEEIPTEQRNSFVCGAASFNDENYRINSTCNLEQEDMLMRTFFKTVTLEGENIVFHQYYTFAKKVLEEYDLYVSTDIEERNLLVGGISESDIGNYISMMPVIKYIYQKDKTGNYFFASVELDS